MKKTATSNVPEESLARARRMVLTRAETRAEADALFGEFAKIMRKEEVEKMRKLFVQFDARDTMTPMFQKEAGAHVREFFEKKAYLTEAQRRYPELLKVAKMAPDLRKRSTSQGASEATGKIPVQSELSGGSA